MACRCCSEPIAPVAADLVGIPNVAALRALPGAANRVVALEGYTTLDGRQGLFQWDTANGVDDGGFRFNAGGLGSNTAGWKRIYNGPWSVHFFGAIGDGVTDDAPAIQRAINAASAAGAKLYFQRGNYLCNAALVVKNNIFFLGDGQANISGASVPATKIIDGRVNPATPFLTFGPDALGQPTSRGCYLSDIFFSFPSAGKTGYSIFIEGTTGPIFNNCTFEWSHNGTGQPTGNPATDPGGIRHTSFEGTVYQDCTFHYGTIQLSFEGSGAGGPLTIERCCFYDCNSFWIKVDSNGDHDYALRGCMFDPLYRTTIPAIGVDFRANGFTVEGCSFYGLPDTQPSGTYLQVSGTGAIRDNQFVIGPSASPRPTAITVNSANVAITNNKINAYNAINCPGGGSSLSTKGNLFIPTHVPDAVGASAIFQHKRAVIVNYSYAGPCSVDLGPDSIQSDADTTIVDIVSATNATPIEIETSVAEPFKTGDTIQIYDATGNTAANGYWRVTRLDATHYQLNGSVGNAAYTGGGHSRLIWLFENSYYVGGNDGGPSYTQFTAGVIHWNKFFDQSGFPNENAAEGARGTLISGNPIVGGLVRLDPLDPQVIAKGNGQTMRHADASGNMVTNEGFISDVEYFLPPIKAGLRYTFLKRDDVVTAGNPSPKMKLTTLPTTIGIVSVSNTTPIVVQTDGFHPFATGDTITITGNAAANGTWVVTRVDSTHFSLDTSAAAGVVAGGTASRATYIFLEGLKDGTLSVADSDTTQYNSRITLEASFRYNTSDGRDQLRWYVSDRQGDWLDDG